MDEFLKEKLKGFKLYQDRYVESKKRKIRVNMNLQKEKNMWGKKFFFYKLFRRNLSPDNNLSQMVYDDIKQLIYMNNSKKRP